MHRAGQNIPFTIAVRALRSNHYRQDTQIVVNALLNDQLSKSIKKSIFRFATPSLSSGDQPLSITVTNPE